MQPVRSATNVLGLGRVKAPSLTQLRTLPDNVRVNCAVAHLAGLCTRERTLNDSGITAVDEKRMQRWVAARVLAVSADELRSLLPDADGRVATHANSCASRIVQELVDAGAIERVTASASDGPRFSARMSESDERTAIGGHALAQEIVAAYCRGVELCALDMSAHLRADMNRVLRTCPSSVRDLVIDAWVTVDEFTDSWLTRDAVRASATYRESGTTSVSPQIEAFMAFERVLPPDDRLMDRRLIVQTCFDWLEGNWRANCACQADRKSMRVHSETFGPKCMRSADDTVVGYALNFQKMSLAQKVFCLGLVDPVESALVSATSTHPVYGRPPISASRSMTCWWRSRTESAMLAKTGFVTEARALLDERGFGAVMAAAVHGIPTRTNRAVVRFGDDMFDSDTARAFLRTEDADAIADATRSPIEMVMLTIGLQLTVFANVVLWRGSTRHTPVYAVNRTLDHTSFGGWVPTNHAEIAATYVSAAIHALDAMRGSGNASDAWLAEFGPSHFASRLGTCGNVADGVVLAMRERMFLAGTGARMQELDPDKPLPIEAVREILRRARVGRSAIACDAHEEPRRIEAVCSNPTEAPEQTAVDVSQAATEHASGAQASTRHGLIPAAADDGPGDGVRGSAAPLLTVQTRHAPIDITHTHLQAMGLRPGQRGERGIGVYVWHAGAWSIPVSQAEGSVYVEDVHELLGTPWPMSDTLAAFSASVYGPTGETWVAVLVVLADNLDTEGPHVRSRIRDLYPYVKRTRDRIGKRLRHCVTRTLPNVLKPVVKNPGSDCRTWQRIATITASCVYDTGTTGPVSASLDAASSRSSDAAVSLDLAAAHGSGSASRGHTSDEGCIATGGSRMDECEIVRHERGGDNDGDNDGDGDGVHHLDFVYVATDGSRYVVPSGSWGRYAAETASGAIEARRADSVRSRVRSYWRTVEVESLDEFLENPAVRRGRMTPHDAAMRMVRPRVFVMAITERSRRVVFHEIALDRVRALAAWDKSAELVEERSDCCVYLLPNTLEPQFPLVVVAGLALSPFVPSSVHDLIARDWRARDLTCPHADRGVTDIRSDPEEAVACYMCAAGEIPYDEPALVEYLRTLAREPHGG